MERYDDPSKEKPIKITDVLAIGFVGGSGKFSVRDFLRIGFFGPSYRENEKRYQLSKN